MTSLNLVALISGGKDSLFSILHCISNGHKIIALANLHPPSTEIVEDMDSFMYQTVGHSVIPLYAQALGLPLYRRAIDGLAVNQEKCYGPAGESDETESLMPLLEKVKAAHPEVNAVSTGAILSDYQRTRVESVALRLGLTPLAYLWQWPSLPPHTEASLLQDMADVGQDSRIIKVASGGLNESFLWRNVADRRTITRLQTAAQKFGTLGDGAVLGEGGEYETLAISGPSQLWKGEIALDDANREIVPGEAGTASMSLRNPRVVANQGDAAIHPRLIPLFDAKFEKMLAYLDGDRETTPSLQPPTTTDKVGHNRDILFLPNLTGYGPNAETQMHSIMDRLSYRLPDYDHDFSDIVYTSIIMRDMADFPKINAVYGSYFSQPNPPARATIACADVLPGEAHLAVAITSFRREDRTKTKLGLHVQSRSYWAPANIGPYSQAISMPLPDSTSNGSLVYIAGQIPLVPASMEVVSSPSTTAQEDFVYQTVLSLQHLSRIGERVGVRKWAATIAFVAFELEDDPKRACRVIRNAWSDFHRQEESAEEAEEDEAEDFDVWNTRNIHTGRSFVTSSIGTNDQDQHLLDGTIPPLHIIRVDALPRGCKIEWTAYGLTSRADHLPAQEIPHLQHLLNLFSARILTI